MYCKQCGTEIADDSIYCSKCGQKQSQKIENQDTISIQGELEKQEGCLKHILIIFAILITIILVFSGIAMIAQNMKTNNKTSQNTNDNTANNYIEKDPQYLSREAKNSDIIIEKEIKITSLSCDLIISPQTNISNLKIKIVFYGKNDQIIFETTKNIGNVKEGIQVSKNIDLSQLGFNFFEIDHFSCSVIEGTVSYLQ